MVEVGPYYTAKHKLNGLMEQASLVPNAKCSSFLGYGKANQADTNTFCRQFKMRQNLTEIFENKLEVSYTRETSRNR